jgi:hypothetical protein
MRNTRMTTAIVGAAALMVVTALPGSASAGGKSHHHEPVAEVLLSDLSSPKGLAVTQERDLAVGQGAFGPPGPVLVFDLHGRDRGTVTPVTDPANLIDVAISPKDGTGWAIDGNDGTLLHQLADGTIVPVANIPEYQLTDPDPVDQDQPANPTEANPYGLAIARNGDALVADAAGNDLLRFTPEGVGITMARFDTESLSTDNLPPDFIPGVVLPDFIDAEAVPTTVTVGPDGFIYVGELKGVPFRPESSHVWRIKPWAKDAWCSVNTPDRSCKVFSDGYTAIQDIAFDWFGRMYVYELAADGVVAFEAGFATGEFPPAVLLQVHRGWWHHDETRTELVAGQLSQPGGVVVTGNEVYVTDGMFSVGRLLHIG